MGYLSVVLALIALVLIITGWLLENEERKRIQDRLDRYCKGE